jgi:hypothetical protein
MNRHIIKAVVGTMALAAAGSASAVVITADNSWNGAPSVVVSGVTIAACNTSGSGACTSPGVIGTKDIPTVGAGAGVQGQGNNEIDWYSAAQASNSEMLRFNFGPGSVIDTLKLGLLFDGPEYTDFQENAVFRVSYVGGSVSTFTLAALFATPGLGTWNGFGSWSGTGLDNGGSGLWTGVNPFGSTGVLQLDLFAAPGTCGTRTACYDQSDFVFRSLSATPVPAPGTLALLGIGLLGLVALRPRRATGRALVRAS